MLTTGNFIYFPFPLVVVESGLPAVAAAAIAVVCTLLLLILISAIVAAILLVLWRKVKTAECDIE